LLSGKGKSVGMRTINLTVIGDISCATTRTYLTHR